MEISQRIQIQEPSVIFDEADGEYVVINLLTGHYFRLNKPSSVLWRQLTCAPTREELLASCSNAEVLESELGAILSLLTDSGLVLETFGERPVESITSWTFEEFSLESYTDLEDILGLDPIHEVDPQKGWPTSANG